LIYKKINLFIDLSKENFEQNNSYLEKLSNNEKEIDKLTDINSNLQKIVDEIPKSEQSTNSKLELREFANLMSRYSEFLNQSKFLKKIDVIESLHMIKTEGGTVDDYKLFFISEFTKLIFSNGLTFKDLDIDNDYYDYGPLEANSVWFDIKNIANVIFTLKDKTKKSLKYEFYDDTIVIYFCNPYHSWERGLNEHTNGLIRQYLPKQTDFTQVKRKQIRFIQDRLNSRPRKSLGYKTPSEVFYARVSKVMAA